MKFRPCIDLHQGQVKQIVGSTLSDSKEVAINFSTTKPAAYFSKLYASDQLRGGHVVMLGPGNTDAARSAIQAAPGYLQVGGGINLENAQQWLEYGASHVIVTSFVFSNAQLDRTRLAQLCAAVGKERLVLDLSCRKRDGVYHVVMDRWQTFTSTIVDRATLHDLAQYCDEFLVHGVDVEGQQLGILDDLVELLGRDSPIPVTYAGGVRSLEDLERVAQLGQNRVDCTIGSALDVFGGTLKYTDVVQFHRERNP